MGQPQSSEEGSHDSRHSQEESVPYTKYSQSKPSSSGKSVNSGMHGITVINPRQEQDLRSRKPLELQKLDKIHRFWPILKSSVDYTQPLEKITDGLDYKELLSMCCRYQEHLQDTAAIVSIEQKALTSRLKDLEMFSAGIAQQMIRRQERMHRALGQLEKVKEVSTTLDAIHSSMEQCVPLLQRLNKLLPERDRLKPFKLHPHLQPQEDDEEEEGGEIEEGEGLDGEGAREVRDSSDAQWRREERESRDPLLESS